jgi:hypothetical protein
MGFAQGRGFVSARQLAAGVAKGADAELLTGGTGADVSDDHRFGALGD